jgi:hypothetical protein
MFESGSASKGSSLARGLLVVSLTLACSRPSTTPLIGGCSAGGTSCPAGQVCFQQSCVPVCIAAGGTVCGGACVDVRGDEANCGGCNNACASGVACTNGSCAASCGTALTLCAPDGGPVYCADLQNDPSDCGACGQTCGPGSQCQQGECHTVQVACPPGQTLCGAGTGGEVCTDPDTDAANCGSCAHACLSGEQCDNGACVPACAPGLSPCPEPDGGSTCVDLTADDTCGTCGVSCGPSGFCSRGACVCAAGYSQCGTATAPSCALLPSDPLNCGACGQRCVPCESCASGACTAEATILSGFTLPVGLVASSVSIAIADLNADGLPDLAVGVSSTGSSYVYADELVIFFGDGGGGFPTSTSIAADPSVSFGDLAVGDLNGDGLADLAILTADTPSGSGTSGFMILYALPDGGLQPGPDIAPLAAGYSLPWGGIQVADFNGDGRNDIAVFLYYSGVDLFYGLSDGGFSAADQLPLPPSSSYGFAAGDLNGDGLADLLVAYGNPVNSDLSSISVFLQQSGSLQLAGTGPAPAGSYAEPVIGGGVLATFTDCDAVVSRWTDAGIVLVADLAVGCGVSQGGWLVDLNGDGIADFVVEVPDSADLYVFLGHSDGQFGVPAIVSSGVSISLGLSFGSGDLNGDGRPDVVEASGNGAAVLLNGCVP